MCEACVTVQLPWLSAGSLPLWDPGAMLCHMYLSIWSHFLALTWHQKLYFWRNEERIWNSLRPSGQGHSIHSRKLLPAHNWGRKSLTRQKISLANRQTAAGRAQAEYLPSEVSYKPTGHDLRLVIRVYTTFSPKATVTLYVLPRKSFCRQAGTSSAGPVSHRELPGIHPEPAGDGDAGLALENKPWSSAPWQHCIVAAQLCLCIRCIFKCFQANQGSQATAYKLSGWFTPIGKTKFNRYRVIPPVVEI